MTDPKHQQDLSAALEEIAHSFTTLEEDLAAAIREAATHIREALTRNPEDFKNSLDLTK